jgi:chorismate mutase
MSPTNKKKLDKLRIKLDKLDNQLLRLIKKRSNLVNDVLKVKIYKKEIIDQKRIKFILKKIKKKSIQSNIDHKITGRIWKNMIWSFIDYEKRNFKRK